MAPEFYDTLPSHPSWPMLMVNFICDSNVGIFSRVKRKDKGVPKVPQTVKPAPQDDYEVAYASDSETSSKTD
jgi:hypothetical protein